MKLLHLARLDVEALVTAILVRDREAEPLAVDLFIVRFGIIHRAGDTEAQSVEAAEGSLEADTRQR